MPSAAGSRPAVCLLSGGLDSTTVLYLARSQGYALYALSFDYGQRHRFELESARKVARAAGAVCHRVLTLDPAGLAGSALTGDGEVPKGRDEAEIGQGIPTTYVPARNTIFLAHALAWAEVLAARDLFIGVNQIDYSGYPDCRPEFLRAFEQLARLATKAGVEGQSYEVHAPLTNLGKAEIIQRGLELGVDFALTHSCYDPDASGHACGACDSCLLRLRGFAEVGIRDPAAYQSGVLRPDQRGAT